MQVPVGELFAQQVHISILKDIIKYKTPEEQLDLVGALRDSKAPPAYQSSILTMVIRSLESCGLDVSDELSDAYAENLVATTVRQSTRHMPTIFRFNGHEVWIDENRNTLTQDGGTGYRTWEAALALGDYLLQQEFSGDTNFVELGAGTGFVSLLLAKLGYASIVATDGDFQVVTRLVNTCERNNLAHVQARVLWWETENSSDLQGLCHEMHDPVVLAADVLYDPETFPAFLFTVRELIGDAGYALVSTTIRDHRTYAHLTPCCESLDLVAEQLALYRPGDSQYFFLPPGSEIVIAKITRRHA